MKYTYIIVFLGSGLYLNMSHCSASNLACSPKRRKAYASQFLQGKDKEGRALVSLSPKDFLRSGRLPEIFFGEGLLEQGDDAMTSAWLRNFLDDEAFQEAPVKQASLDAMLSYAADKPHVPIEFIKVLLDHGADPCFGYSVPIIVTMNHLKAGRASVSALSQKLYSMVIAASSKKICDADRQQMRMDRLGQLRDMLGDYTNRLSSREYSKHCEIWSNLCIALGAQSKHSVVPASPIRPEESPFGKFAAQCFVALQRKKEHESGYYSAED